MRSKVHPLCRPCGRPARECLRHIPLGCGQGAHTKPDRHCTPTHWDQGSPKSSLDVCGRNDVSKRCTSPLGSSMYKPGADVLRKKTSGGAWPGAYATKTIPPKPVQATSRKRNQRCKDSVNTMRTKPATWSKSWPVLRPRMQAEKAQKQAAPQS